MNEHRDWQLVDQARDGDMQAFAALVERYQGPVIHFCERMTGSRQEAEDLAQESFIRVYRHLPRLKQQAKFSTLLFGIARNLALNALRDAKRRGRDKQQSLTQQENPGMEWPVADDTRRPDRGARLAEIETLVEKALKMVSEEHREVLLLREVQGFDYEAIARVLKVRKGTVKSRLARAREQLRERVLELGGAHL